MLLIVMVLFCIPFAAAFKTPALNDHPRPEQLSRRDPRNPNTNAKRLAAGLPLLQTVHNKNVWKDSDTAMKPRASPIRVSASVAVVSHGYVQEQCIDQSNGPALVGATYTSVALTHNQCTAYCSQHGYNYAGFTAGNTCSCGHQLSNGAVNQASVHSCNQPCNGDVTKTCGGQDSNTMMMWYGFGHQSSSRINRRSLNANDAGLEDSKDTNAPTTDELATARKRNIIEIEQENVIERSDSNANTEEKLRGDATQGNQASQDIQEHQFSSEKGSRHRIKDTTTPSPTISSIDTTPATTLITS